MAVIDSVPSPRRAALALLLPWLIVSGACSRAARTASRHAPAAAAQEVTQLPAQQSQAIDALARNTLARLGAPSASVAVVQGGHLAYVHAYGWGRLDPKIPATPEQRYAVGSISKQFTATAMLMLMQQGKLRLDDPVGKYLPGVRDGNRATLRQLLSHTSGYEDYWPQDYVMPPMRQPTMAELIVHDWARKPLDFPPGTQWQYSNTNFVMAGLIVQKVSGEPLMQFLQQRLFTPLHLGDLGDTIGDMNLNPTTAAQVQGYVRHALGPLRPAPATGPGWLFGAGELALTARQLAQWDIGMLEQKLLQPATYREMETAVKLKDGSETRYGLGLEVGTWRDHRFFGHSGEVGGFTADEIAFPAERDAVVVLTNAMANDTADALAHGIAGIILGLPVEPAAAATAVPTDQSEHRSGTRLQADPGGVHSYAALRTVQDIFAGLREGHIDRGRFSANANAYFNQQTLDDYASSLAPLGVPTGFTLASAGSRGGMAFRNYVVTYPDRHLNVSTYMLPNGQFEQYMVMPAGK